MREGGICRGLMGWEVTYDVGVGSGIANLNSYTSRQWTKQGSFLVRKTAFIFLTLSDVVEAAVGR